MDFDKDTPLNRVANETIKAHTALMDYWQIGAGRSLVNLCQIYTKPMPDPEPPTVHIATLKVWSSRYHWQARIARQIENENAVTLERRRQTLEQIEEQYRQRHMSEAEALALISDIARGDMGDFADVLSLADLAKLDKSRLVKKATFHYSINEDGTITGRLMIDLHDAQKALELILKHHGAFAADNKHQNLNIDMSDLTDEQLKRIADGEDPLNVISD
ncbi:hypothetical protein LCGC14_0937470 [marine sediment metagenome]|uniref:Uncharacterized protein n=1 Tax=marine sediment metagenome TaxID=412755 RepID=A0A0F9P770_9ZZZZ